ncbi:dipeptidyl peptidase IV N-terminal region-domain-containing protein [Emericellopsis atlantica]|uniref:Probable dipeptidyl-aminopeptidase B n=1 Tax=Emericellopsis atlantica TaxID=2614577 RepID=A0A9P8CPD7_9HYPO|nr:dipeptidyl peptidase IV N-terminal region-domain-containing protein [Emericellopsis atlantica]KAG9254413.1 dipeptidyl peptidase IV N-terminal region-domain-containing protein [Emericellopsis atlantica]
MPSLWTVAIVAGVAAAIDPPRAPEHPKPDGDRLLAFNETVPRAVYGPKSISVAWSSAGNDGQYITTNSDGDLVLEDIVTETTETFVPADQLPEDYSEYWISSDASRVLLSANATKQYRYSYFADYFILDVESGESTPLVDDQVGDIQYAEMAPTGDAIAFVRDNNLYLRDHATGDITQITNDGGPDMFHGVPDWVYEEEIFGGRYTLWFSPDAKFVAFLSFNETGVGTFTIPYYMNNQELAPVYPDELDLRYPKVGSKNPTVQLNILDVASGEFETVETDAFPEDELVIGEVAWVTDTHTDLIYRAYNRVQDHDAHVVVDPVALTSKTVRERDGSDGWLENTMSISYVGPLKSSCNNTYYVDMSDESGWAHIYLYPVKGGKAIQLTKGDWEVASILKIDTKRSLIYYSAAQRHSTERHVYKVSYKTNEITPLVDDKVAGYWSASFSSEGGYYILTYAGPNVPYQELYTTNSTSKPLRTLVDNAEFIETLSEFRIPSVTWFELEHPDGYKMNVQQNLPANFDPSKKYPVLFTPYGGPNSQTVAKRFQSMNWNMYIGSDPELEYITYTVDNRGTAMQGRAYRSLVTSQLGKLEPLDQIWAAEQLIAQNDFIDAKRVGMFGWSYGGYLTAKTLEVDSGVFTLGLIVAPVSDWRFYDTLYTERYMKTLDGNKDGYLETAVHNVDGFKNVAGGFSVLHGTGDDNVHYQHTAAMIDLLVAEGVPPEKMHMFAFTDSDHSINYNGADVWIRKYLTDRLFDEKLRKVEGERLVHQWSKRAVV